MLLLVGSSGSAVSTDTIADVVVVCDAPNRFLIFDPSDARVVAFDWDRFSLRSGVEINTSTFTINVVKQSGLTALTKDNPAILNQAEGTAVLGRATTANRVTIIRLIATTATEGDLYEVANAITTLESPSTTKEQSVRILIQNQ